MALLSKSADKQQSGPLLDDPASWINEHSFASPQAFTNHNSINK